jgi:hypothetical protein
MRTQRWLQVLWPAFLAAGVLEMLVFALIDPSDVQWLGQPLDLSRQGIYSVSFFIFWGLTSVSGALTVLFADSETTQDLSKPSLGAH